MADRWHLLRILIVSFLCVLFAAAYAPDTAWAQAPLPPQFQHLSPEQRQAIARILRGDAAPVEAPAAMPVIRPVPTGAPPVPDTRAAGPPRFQPGDTVLLSVQKTPAPDDPAALLTDKKIYVLDQAGAIVLPDAGRIILAGLNEKEAGERIAIEPALRGRIVTAQLLPVEQELKPFGYELFRGDPAAFAPVTDIPVPADYIVGPGDSVIVQLFGRENIQHELAVTRDGTLLFPGIGPLSVAGLTFARLQQEIHTRIQRQLSGVNASVTLGRIRSIRVFVLGDVERPGSYVVSGMSTLTNALFVSGGVKPIGSLRDIQLKRNGKIISRMDLYDLLLRGNTAADARLLPGDVIFVASGGSKAGVTGQVRRPAIYELKDERNVEDLIAMAGGLLPEAFPRKVQIERIEENHRRVLLDVDLTQPQGKQLELRDGDVVRVHSVLDRVSHAVYLSGRVNRPGSYQWFSGMRLTDLIPSASDLQPQADGRYLLIKREDPVNHAIRLFDVDLAAALEDAAGDVNPLLQPNDEVRVFDISEDRHRLIEPLLAQAEAQSAPGEPVHAVTIEGTVHHPGRYPLSPEMKVGDLLRAAGGLTDRAYTLAAELTRHSVIGGERREMSRYTIDLAAVLKGESSKDMALAAYDQVVVRRIPSWDDAGTIELRGEVMFPGAYPVARGDKLSQVIERAGGLSPEAYPRAAVFLRESVRLREQESIDQLAARLERELSQVRPDEEDAITVEGQLLLKQIHAARATGRMVINLEALLKGEAGYDISVNPGDRLYIPQRPEEVTVIGEVYNPTSHLYNPRLGRNEYLRLSGGVTESGNKKAVYVVHADGSVSPSRGWFGGRVVMGPGDTVVVPMKLERISKLKVITSVSQILYQLALTAASLDVVGVF